MYGHQIQIPTAPKSILKFISNKFLSTHIGLLFYLNMTEFGDTLMTKLQNNIFFIIAVSSLWSVFSSESLAPKDIWQTSLASKLIPAMNRLLEDDSVKV